MILSLKFTAAGMQVEVVTADTGPEAMQAHDRPPEPDAGNRGSR